MSCKKSPSKNKKTAPKVNNNSAASASLLGEDFYNPYTFIPFPKKAIEKNLPTPLTIDESEIEERFSGVLELKVKTLSPLMTCHPEPVQENTDHKTYKALTIENDVIVPATGIRGSLRTLLTIITGGSLGYIDEDLYLYENNVVQLGPRNKKNPNPDIPKNVFLAKVIRAGSSTRSGIIELGETRLVRVEDLEKDLGRLDKKRPTNQRTKILSYKGWEVKLSGRPIKRKGKREGLFKGTGIEIELPEHFWAEYQGKHRHAVVKELKKGDLVWLEPSDAEAEKIESAQEIKSLQWSRWGKGGKKLKDSLKNTSLLPDNMSSEGHVDWITDLFGQVPNTEYESKAHAFAARVRPGNLIFFDAKNNTTMETLAPLGAPHPSCIAFYRDEENLDNINIGSELKGYKVYRNTKERGEQAPWKFTTQGIYDAQGKLHKSHKQKMNKTAELLNEGQTGTLKISFRALNKQDLALLYSICTVDWKLGGGKPLGLGHCRVIDARVIDENGDEMPLSLQQKDSAYKLTEEALNLIKERVADFEDRHKMYQASQQPVDKLRYPRAVNKNNNGNSRSGLAWFARHAKNKMGSDKGLGTLWVDGNLKSKVMKDQVKAQALPKLDIDCQGKDKLYGYDMIDSVKCTKKNPTRSVVSVLEPFDKIKHITGKEKSGQNISQNKETRQKGRDERAK